MDAIGPCGALVNRRSMGDRTWIVAYSAAEGPATYYRYDRADGGGELTRLFSSRPVLDGKPLVPMWPQEIKSRDGLTLVSYLSLPQPADADTAGKAAKTVPIVLPYHGAPWARAAACYTAYRTRRSRRTDQSVQGRVDPGCSLSYN